MAASHLNKILSHKELIDALGSGPDVLLVRHAIFFRTNNYVAWRGKRQSVTKTRSIMSRRRLAARNQFRRLNSWHKKQKHE